MDRDEIDRVLGQTLEDRFLSRGEKRALREVLRDLGVDERDTAFWRHRAFALAREQLVDARHKQIVEWLEDVVKVLEPQPPPERPSVAEVCFSPGEQCRRRIAHHLDTARSSADICVFTITDDRLAAPILDCHRRGIRVRVITDDDKSSDPGSDVDRLARAGVPVRRDMSEHHMHHKFAVFDRETLVTGSYNWTRSAADHNRENVLISDDARLVRCYVDAFEELWKAFAP